MFNTKIIVGPPGKKKMSPLWRYQIALCISRSGVLTESFRRLFSTKLGLTGRSGVPTWGIIVIKKSYETESSLPKFSVIRNVIVKTKSQILLVLSVLKNNLFQY
jgi:hypothetical protein